jgi:CO/xanthine dehydrogenase FAD-binding subunit
VTEFHAPKTIEQACELLAGGKAKILAGGTDLMIELRRLRIESKELPEKLVDVTRIPELQAVDINADKSFIGAAVTYRQLENDHIIRRSFNLLSQAASTVGSTQIRQTGTLGGNAGTSSPAGDGVAALTAFG